MRLYNVLLADFEELFMGYSAIAIIASSCLGSIAAMLILMNGHTFINMFQLFWVVVVCMGFNAAILAQFKPKFVFNALIVSLVLNTFFIIYNFITLA